MAKISTRSLKSNKKGKATPRTRASRNVKTRAFRKGTDVLRKEIAPLEPIANVVASRVGNVLIGILEGAVFGFEQIAHWLQAEVTKRLEDVPVEEILEPDPRIAVPAVQALIYSMNDEIIREMFATLLVSSINQETRSAVHPAFVQMIKEMTPIDAKTLMQFRAKGPHINYRIKFVTGSTWISVGDEFSITGLDIRDVPHALDNLIRMGLIEKRETEFPLLEGFDIRDNKDNKKREIESRYKSMFDAWSAQQLSNSAQDRKLQVDMRGLYLTALGNSFLACISGVKTH